jgi:SAM-dependent methyltransferase
MSIDQEKATIDTYDRNAAAWSTIHNYDLTKNNFAGALTEFYELVADGSTVLEVGCGGGRDAAELVKHYDYLGTDASAGMVQSAREYVPTGEFQQCSVYDLNSLGKTFDAYWAAAVLLHIPKHRIDEALQAIKAAVKPNAVGMIAIKDGDREEFEVRQADGLHEERLFTYWTEVDFRTALDRNAIDVISYTYRPLSQRTNWHIFLTRNRT